MGLLDNDQLLLGLSLMQAGSAKPVRTGLGEGLLSGLMNVQAMQDQRAQRAAQEEERKMRQAQMQMQQEQMNMQLAERQRLMQEQQGQRNYLGAMDASAGPAIEPTLPGMLARGFSPDVASALIPKRADPSSMLGKIDPKDYAPETFAEFMKTGNPAALRAAPKDQAPDEFEKALRLAGIDPASPQGRSLTLARLQKMATHQPATSVNVNTEKPLLNTVATGLGQQIDASLSNAKAASQAIGTAQAIKSAIDTGKVIAGPGASFRVAGLQIGQTLGIGGKDAAEILSNTRTAIQSMAKAELEAAQQMKGQGQITEAERDIIRRAASGDINSLTAGEMRLLADSMEKTARSKISQHKKNVEALGKMPNAAAILPFYQVDEPPAYQGSTGRVRRYNPQTQALE